MKHELIQVKYRNSQEGFVDDVTLNELILSRKIKHFYRPSQEKWIDIETDPVRMRESQYGGPERREPDEDEESEQFAPKKALTAEDWLVTGYKALYNDDDSKRALRAFAKSIHLEPAHLGAYFNRGITYERVGNFQQAIDDYSKAIELAPGDAAVYYLRGRARKRLGMDDEAVEDLEKAARMGYRQADVKAVTPAIGGIPSSALPRTEKPEMPDVVKLRHQSEKLSSLERKKRKNRFPLIASLGVLCTLVLVLMAVFFWSTKPDDFISSMGKIYPPRSDKPTDQSVIVPPLEDAKLKGQTGNLSVINSSKSSKGKEYSIQIRAYPETGKNAAMKFVTELKKIQSDVHMERVYIPERGIWYRILVGHFANIEKASTYLKEKKIFKTYPGSFVQLASEKYSPPEGDFGHINPQ
ncbi:MAG TPA: tetratricopeptide repeat protein [Syntrophales bacterium]|nr:tetratricopeptide repeat protein [Syntrophales bacterium]